MEVKCPHCDKMIEIVGSKELEEDFGVSANKVQHARTKGRFPQPWLSLGNRMLYLRRDVEAYRSELDGVSTERAIEMLKSTLSPEQLEKVIEDLRASS